jgi:hypothetical protein
MLSDQDQNQPNPASTPDESAETQGRREDPQQAPDVANTATDGAQPSATQGNMGDGSGQRGGYGDSDQTNGMEGGGQTVADDRAE